jgi:hypothetical protein
VTARFDRVAEELARLAAVTDVPREFREWFDEALLHGWEGKDGLAGDAGLYAIARHFFELGRKEACSQTTP